MKPNAKQLREKAEEATFIRCRYCAIKDTCPRRERKEAVEATGMLTYCTITPNKNKKKRQKR